MSSLTISIEEDLADKIVVDALCLQRELWKNDLGAGNAVFAWDDQEQDDEELQKHIDAAELLLKWYAPPAKLEELGLKD